MLFWDCLHDDALFFSVVFDLARISYEARRVNWVVRDKESTVHMYTLYGTIVVLPSNNRKPEEAIESQSLFKKALKITMMMYSILKITTSKDYLIE